VRNLYLIAIAAAALGCTTLNEAGAGELPAFELMGFSISPHQVSVSGSAGVSEPSPTSMLTFRGMPASPHQIAVLTSRRSLAMEATAAGLTPNGLSAE
jgi:hypothetical protein